MNNYQKTVIFIYSTLVFLMIIFPPYELELQGFIIRSEYSSIFTPIMQGDDYGKVPLGVINTSKLLIQILGATLISISLVLSLNEKVQK